MSHFAVFPSATEAAGHACSKRWEARGYECLVAYDVPENYAPAMAIAVNGGPHLLWMPKPFKGYYKVINEVVGHAFDLGADLVTCLGDDMDPDPSHTAGDIEAMYFEWVPDGFGVLQATGDPQGMDNQGRSAAARICGSPTFGRGWFERAYGGRGPFHDSYSSYYGDEDLWNVAKLSGVLWQEPKLTIFHKHWSWDHQPQTEYQKRNSSLHWQTDQQLFFQRQREGFPGWQPKA